MREIYDHNAFMEGAEPCSLFKDAQREMTDDFNRNFYQRKEEQWKRQNAIAEIMHMPVGGEI